MTPVEALERVVHCLDRAHETGFKTKAFVRALDVVRTTPPEELEQRAAAGPGAKGQGDMASPARVHKRHQRVFAWMFLLATICLVCLTLHALIFLSHRA